MTEKEINDINRYLKGKTFSENVRFWSSDEPNFEVEYKFKILGTKKMISVGEYYDHLILDIEIVDADDITTQLFGIYAKIGNHFESAIEKMVKDNYLFIVDITYSIRELLKYFSSGYVRTTVNNITISNSFIKKIEEFKDTV